MDNNKNIENAIVEVIGNAGDVGCSPMEIRTPLEEKGFSRDEIRDAVVELDDRKVLYLGDDDRFYLFK